MKIKYAWLRRWPALSGIGLSLLLLLAVWLLKDKCQKPPHTKKLVQQITMIQPPPPPPPPPEQKPPEPEVKEQKIEEPEPEPEPEPSPEKADEPPAEELGLDTDGTAGSDGFGLAAHKGGRSILGGGGGGNASLWYGGQVSRQLEAGMQKLVAEDPVLKTDYTVIVDVWVDQDGRITRSELAVGSNQPDVDRVIRNALPKLKVRIGKPPPENMPQPIRIRLISRG